jgi:hypothetical protein
MYIKIVNNHAKIIIIKLEFTNTYLKIHLFIKKTFLKRSVFTDGRIKLWALPLKTLVFLGGSRWNKG